jgi:hypothetical protein
VTAPAPHRPFTSHCADREDAQRRATTAALGAPTQPAPTPVAPRPTDPGQAARHTLGGCPARDHSAPCLCIRGKQ